MTIKNTRTKKVKYIYNPIYDTYLSGVTKTASSFVANRENAKEYSYFSLPSIIDMIKLRSWLGYEKGDLRFKKFIELNWSIKGKALVEQVKPKEVE